MGFAGPTWTEDLAPAGGCGCRVDLWLGVVFGLVPTSRGLMLDGCFSATDVESPLISPIWSEQITRGGVSEIRGRFCLAGSEELVFRELIGFC